MLTVRLPDDNHKERRYIAGVMLENFLGLKCDYIFEETANYTLELENGNRLILEDHFFQKHPVEKAYLSLHNIPENIHWLKKSENPFLPEDDLPVIFGNGKLEVSETKIVLGADLFASAFFCLSRWEEVVNPVKDEHGRFTAKASIAGKFDFLHRPVVNEYVEVLWSLLKALGIRQERKTSSFELLLTHDIDYPRLWHSPRFFLKKLGGDVSKRLSLREASFSITSYLKTLAGKPDPHDTFDYIMKIAEEAGSPAHFFMMTGGKTGKDPRYYPLQEPFFKKLLQNITERGHRTGIHPSYGTFQNEDLWEAEKQRLELISRQPVTICRQHFLRFQMPDTCRIWANQNMEWDSTLGYAEKEGFRSGTSDSFPLFDVVKRKKLGVLERPLLVMDGTLRIYQKLTADEMLSRMRHLLGVTKKYRSTFSILWHNSAFHTPDYLPSRHVYEQIVREATEDLA